MQLESAGGPQCRQCELEWVLALVLSLTLCGFRQVTISVCLILSIYETKTMPFLYLFHGEVMVK